MARVEIVRATREVRGGIGGDEVVDDGDFEFSSATTSVCGKTAVPLPRRRA